MTVELFGSSVTGFALSSSDVNINLNIGSDIENSQVREIEGEGGREGEREEVRKNSYFYL